MSRSPSSTEPQLHGLLVTSTRTLKRQGQKARGRQKQRAAGVLERAKLMRLELSRTLPRPWSTYVLQDWSAAEVAAT